MNLIDTHSHLYLEEVAKDLRQVIESAEKNFVTKIIMPNLDLYKLGDMLDVERRFPKLCKSMIGLHPCYVDKNFEETLQEMHTWFAKHKFVAIGEVGIDLFHSTEFYDEQVEAFRIQLQWAAKNNLPVAIHSRNSFKETMNILRHENISKLKGIFHCFSGGVDEAKEALDLGLKLGIGGVITFKNSNLGDVVRKVGLENIVLETDAPYLAPVPHRGKRNEPAYLLYIAKAVASILEMDLETVATLTTKNAKEVFGLSDL